MNLQIAVESFARAAYCLSDSDLERPWTWGDYNEGLRFAFFQTYLELRALAVNLLAQRESLNRPLTQAQAALGQYHRAYQDLRAALVGVSDTEAERTPAPGEWSVRSAVAHIVESERSFFAVTRYAVERTRAADRGEDEWPLELSDEAWDEFWRSNQDVFEQIKDIAHLSELLDYYTGLHGRVMTYFADVTNAELQAPAVFWESTAMPVAFRLHRFDAHLRQHTIQIDKTLEAINGAPGEARRLLRLVFNALAETQAYRIIKPAAGGARFGAAESDALANEIMRRTDEIIALTR